METIIIRCESKRGADIGSDHHLVAKFKVKIQAYSQRTRQLRKRYDISKLKEDMKARELFKIELKNRFQILTDMVNIENKSVEETWRKTRTTFVETNENVLGFKERNKKDWMVQQTWEKIREWKNVKEEMNVYKTRARKIELQNKYTEKNQEVKRSVRRDQKNYIDNLSYQAEETANKGNIKELFAITRIFSKRKIQRN